MVTLKPRQSKAAMPMRWRVGICSRSTSGIGRSVTTRSATQLTMPRASVCLSSSMQREPGGSGIVQYELTGLRRGQFRDILLGKDTCIYMYRVAENICQHSLEADDDDGRDTHRQESSVTKMHTTKTIPLNAIEACNVLTNHLIPLFRTRR